MSCGRAAALICFAALLALAAAEGAAARPALLPSPTAPLDSTVPVGGPIPSEPFLLPRNGRVVNRERVAADVLHDGTVVRVRVIQRLTLTGTGDFSFQIPAPLRDVKAARGSQGEPGLRPTAIIWQGFANRRRVLAADAQLVPRTAAGALPLRVELRATVDGRPLVRGERESGRLRLSLRLLNTTAVRALTFAAAARPGAVRRVLARIAAGAKGTPSQPSIDVQGPISGRQVVVDAPFVVRGEVRLPVSSFTAAAASGGTVVSGPQGAVLRFRRVIGGPATPTATISLAGSVRGAGPPEAVLTARPAPLVPEVEHPPRDANASELVLLAGRSLLRLARAHQFDAFLATPGGSTRTVYSFRTVIPPATSSSAATGDDGDNVVLVILVATGAVVLAGGLVVLWAHL